MSKQREVVLSVSSVDCYEKCPWAYFLRYDIGWRLDKDKKTYRIGRNYHKGHEILGSEPGGKCWRCIQFGGIDEDCYMCGGTGVLPDDLMESVSNYLSREYSVIPEGWDEEKWNAEKFMILYALVAHKWHYPENEFEVVATEIPFSLPIINPDTGRKLPSCRLDGIIDAIWKHVPTGLLYIGEIKSTSSTIGSDGEFWKRLDLGKQVTVYLFAARMLQLSGALEEYGVKSDDPLIHGAWYDVWKKPATNPKALTQKDSLSFSKDHIYFGHKFEVGDEIVWSGEKQDEKEIGWLLVNDATALVIKGAREGTFTLRETPEMWASRYMNSIVESPESYFEKKEIVRDNDAIKEFNMDCVKLVDLIRYTRKKNYWLRHTSNCKRPFKCDYYTACYNHRDHPTDPVKPPEGYIAKHKDEEKK